MSKENVLNHDGELTMMLSHQSGRVKKGTNLSNDEKILILEEDGEKLQRLQDLCELKMLSELSGRSVCD